MTFHYL